MRTYMEKIVNAVVAGKSNLQKTAHVDMIPGTTNLVVYSYSTVIAIKYNGTLYIADYTGKNRISMTTQGQVRALQYINAIPVKILNPIDFVNFAGTVQKETGFYMKTGNWF